MNHLDFEFYLLLTLVIMLSNNSRSFVSSLDDHKGITDFLIQSTNLPNFSLKLLPSDDQDSNNTWKGSGFQLKNISSILSDFPSVAHSISVKNTSQSRYLFSNGNSASLTVTLKHYKHRILLLNFSYFIGKIFTSHQSPDENSTVDTTTNSLSSLSETLKIPEQTKASGSRKKRFAVNEEVSKRHLGKKMKKRHDTKNLTTKPTTMKPTNDDESSSVTPIARTNESSGKANVLDLKKLKQAIEVIKSAAAVVSKDSVTNLEASTSSPEDTGHRFVAANNVRPNKKGNTGIKSSVEPSTAVAEKTTPPLSAIPNLKNKTHSHSHQHHKKKNKNKKVDDEDHVNYYDDERTDSSSGSMEKNGGHDAEKKISYKMWRASLEKKNRPPGLFVTVNEDIIFDNWDGIWDKNYMLGKWTGLKAFPDGKWNQTKLFINWGNVTTGSDVKIIFEWEPPSEDLDLVLKDIDISTLDFPEPTPPPPHDQSGKNGKLNKQQLTKRTNDDRLIIIKDADADLGL